MTDPRRGRILLVDDEAHLRVTMGDYLTSSGFDVTTAKSGEEALREIARHPPDLIILDIRMPGMGGLHFLKTITNEAGVPLYPVIIVTAVSAMKEFFGTLPVQGFLAKPCDEQELLKMVRRILAAKDPAPGVPRRTSRRLLIVEDDVGAGDQIRTAFLRAGYEARVASTGPEALERVAVEKPDVILLKEVIPGMNGSAVAKIISAMPSTREIPIVLYDETLTIEAQKQFGRRIPDCVRVFLMTDDPAVLLRAVNGMFEPLAAVSELRG